MDAGGGQSQVGQNLLNHHGIVDAGDDAAAALAFGTDQNVDAEDAAHEFGPEQVSASAFAAIVGSLVPHGHCQSVGGLADDFGSESGGGGEDAVVADEVGPWRRQEGDEVQGGEGERGGAVAPWALQGARPSKSSDTVIYLGV